jgi:drug/metabolite transporter (DMT)-like permease
MRPRLKLSLKTENAFLNISIATLFFSFMQVIVKHLKDLPFFELVFFRAGISLIFAFGALKVAGISPRPSNIKWVIIRGLAGTLSLMAYFYSLQTLPLTTAVILQYLSPLFSVLWASMFFREPATVLQWFFLLTAFMGVYVAKGIDGHIPILDIGIGILGAALSGMSYNAIRQLKDTDPPLRVVFYFPLMTVFIAAPFAFLNWAWPTFDQWLFILALGLFTWLAQIFMTKAYQQGPPGVVNIVGYTGIFYAAFFGYILFEEKLTLLHSFGILIMLVSVVTSTWVSQVNERKNKKKV